MESQRNLLLLALLFVSFLLYQAWVVEQNPEPVAVQTTEQTTKTTSSVPSSSNYSADVPASTETAVNSEVPTQLPTNESVILESDTLRLAISLIGGDVITADLLEHDVEKGSETPFRILDSGNGFTYIAQSGLIGQGPDANKKGRPFYSVTTDETAIADGAMQVSTALRFVDENGNVFTKTFTLKRGEYVVNVKYTVENRSDNALNVQLYGQLKETIKDSGTNMMMPVYRGGAFSTSETRYQKYSFDDMKDGALSK
ncbi:MAG: membrane protein insertase YidC, partial [Psychromonas sp.]|nr:membrane protein insertase YidC [Psychromonas sp.]